MSKIIFSNLFVFLIILITSLYFLCPLAEENNNNNVVIKPTEEVIIQIKALRQDIQNLTIELKKVKQLECS